MIARGRGQGAWRIAAYWVQGFILDENVLDLDRDGSDTTLCIY